MLDCNESTRPGEKFTGVVLENCQSRVKLLMIGFNYLDQTWVDGDDCLEFPEPILRGLWGLNGSDSSVDVEVILVS